MENQNGCLVCGKELLYKQDATSSLCVYCNISFPAPVTCPEGHFVCDECHGISAKDMIYNHCFSSDSTDPISMAQALMKDNRIKMHGPEHHFLVPAVLASAYYNELQQPDEKKKKLRIVQQKSEKVPGGFCGTHGNCGAGVGAGIFLSTITEATPLSEKEWELSNQITAISLMEIARQGGPRCCKRDTYIAIREAVKFVNQYLKVNLTENDEIICDFSRLNRQCKLENCIFYPAN